MKPRPIPYELIGKIAEAFEMTVHEALHGMGEHSKQLRAAVRRAIIYTVWAETTHQRFLEWLDEVNIGEDNSRAPVRIWLEDRKRVKAAAMRTPYYSQERWWVGLSKEDQMFAIVQDTVRRLTDGKEILTSAINNLIFVMQ